MAVGDARVEVKQKSRSKSLSEVAALAKLLKLPHVSSKWMLSLVSDV